MNRLCLVTVFLFAIVMASDVFAQIQIQKGVARKITRSASDPFVPVQGVQVVVGEQANKASDKDGRFSLTVKITDKAGSYALTAVRMPQGSTYMLASPSQGKQLFVSANDLEISLITPEEKNLEYKKKYNTLKEKYEAQSLSLRKLRNELDKHLDELSESDVHYANLKAECDSVRKLYLDYINNEDKVDEVIKQLAEELALTDYQSLDSLELKIYELKSAGQWKALNELIRESMLGGAEEAWNTIEQQRRDADVKVEQAKLELAGKLSEQQRIMQQRSQWFKKMETAIESFKMQHLNDSVSHYYEILTKADSTNWKYLDAAGKFEDYFCANYNGALNYFYRSLTYADKDSLKAENYNHIANTYYIQSNYSLALSFHQKALEIRNSSTGSVDIAISYLNIGNIYADLGENIKAMEYYQKSLQIHHSLGKDSFNIAGVYYNISRLFEKQGQVERAFENCRKAIELFRSAGSIQDQNIALCYNLMGIIHKMQGDYNQAIVYYNKALDINLTFYGQSHPEVARNYSNIGRIHFDQGDYLIALEYYEKALKIRLSVYRENHLEVVENYNSIAAIYDKQRDYSTALEYYKKSLNIRLFLYGENHPDLAGVYNNVGRIYFNQGDYSIALEYYEKALKINLSVYGENHPEVANSYFGIGIMDFCQKEYVKAIRNIEKSLSIKISVCDENNKDLIIYYQMLGNLYREQKNYSKALMYYEKLLMTEKAIYGENHSDIAECYYYIGYIHRNQSEYIKALEYFTKALKIINAISTSTVNYPSLKAGALNQKAYVCAALKRYDKAIIFINEALTIQPENANLYDSKGEILLMSGDVDGAVEMWKRVIEIEPDYSQENTELYKQLKTMDKI